MIKITYEQFLNLLSKYDTFDSVVLNAMYKEFGKEVINKYFERYFESIGEEHIDEFVSKYASYFDSLSLEFVSNEIDEYDTRGIINPIVHRSYKYSIMSPEFEKEQGLVLCECKKKLSIVSNCNNSLELYPRLDLAKIFVSIKNKSDLDLLAIIKKIPYSYDDDSILKEEIPIIKRYLKLCLNGIPDINILKKEFPDLCFDSVDVVDNLEEQVRLLKELIYAKFNFYNRNLRLVISFSRRFCKKYNFEEKLQEGCIGLTRAINNFDISMNCRFSTYATSGIVQSICRYVANNSFFIRKPVYIYDEINRYNRFVSSFVLQNGVEPSFLECLDGLGISAEKLREIQKESLDVLSLDMSFSGDKSEDELIFTIADTSVSIEDDFISRDVVECIRKEIYSLFDDREREILLNRLGLDTNREKMTLEELGSCYGVTRERIRQIEHKCKRRLKTKLKHMEII